MLRPRILLIDAYDSFTHNLSALLASSTPAEVHTIYNDSPFASLFDLLPYLRCFDAVVVGPGPGSPEIPGDVGIAKELWHLADSDLLPIFGVCLGLQSLCLEFGGSIERLSVVKHGLISEVEHCGEGLFEGVGKINAVRYHSLRAMLPPTPHGKGEITPLAWTYDENGKVLMAARHSSRPFWAVQYHPESICTEGGGDSVIKNFWRLAREWNKHRGREILNLPREWKVRPRQKSLVQQQIKWELERGIFEDTAQRRCEVRTKTVTGRGLEVGKLCEMLGVEGKEEFVLLESAAKPGRWTIIGVLSPGITRLIKHSVGEDHVTISRMGEKNTASRINLKENYDGSIWRFLAKFMDQRKATNGREEVPFWGGLVGYFDYEIGVASLGIPLQSREGRKGNERPDVNLAFVERSIVIDGAADKIYIQTLFNRSQDGGWLEVTKRRIQQEADIAITPAATPPPPNSSPPVTVKSPAESPPKSPAPQITRPSKQAYISKVVSCQSNLSAGDSYELCLTAQTHIRSHPRDPWPLYRTLRTVNPAPYAAFIRLQGTTLLSSSPERFLSWTRTNSVQLRPIKGTVRKTPATTLASATTALNAPKERAENLMIVDLIRHEVHRLAAPHNVAVTKLMSVEEYETVFQLVSVIEAPLHRGLTGFDLLANSLPPGSMTGAPKKRSVEILQSIEDEERGVYSGIIGYWSVCGGGDWAVVIRSAYRYDDECGGGEEVWRVGAGGAVTALSSAVEEEEEMRVKLASTLRALEG